MSAATDEAVILFPEDYDEQSAYETPLRGYLSDVIVRLADGSRYQLFFIDPVRLQQELADHVRAGRPFFTEPNLVVLPEVTTAAICKAVEGLRKEEAFRQLKPLGG
jgi:hypothetical protein